MKYKIGDLVTYLWDDQLYKVYATKEHPHINHWTGQEELPKNNRDYTIAPVNIGDGVIVSYFYPWESELFLVQNKPQGI